MYYIIKMLPKKFISFLTGVIVSLDRPKFLANALCNLFLKLYDIDLTEAEEQEFSCLQELFTRKLKPGARTFSGKVCSPADGFLSQISKIDNQTLVQAKGFDYSVHEFLDRKNKDDYASYFTVYLAPYNYHRVHSPVAGTLKTIKRIPGNLWPVNEKFTNRVSNLFVKNERVIFEIETDNGGVVSVVMVGALNVGNIEVSVVEDDQIKLGDEIGIFKLGSTVVVILDDKAMQNITFNSELINKTILVGQSLTL